MPPISLTAKHPDRALDYFRGYRSRVRWSAAQCGAQASVEEGGVAEAVAELAFEAADGDQVLGCAGSLCGVLAREGSSRAVMSARAVASSVGRSAEHFRRTTPDQGLSSAPGSLRLTVCRARLWWSRERDTFIASVSLDLGEPASLIPVNSIDTRAGYLLVPARRTYQVNREDEHLDVLTTLVRRAYIPGKVAFYATLRTAERIGPRSTTQIITVHIDGHEIGELTKQSSAKLMPLVRPMESAGIVCYTEVVLTGNALAVDARVHVTPAEELAPEFLAQLEGAIYR